MKITAVIQPAMCEQLTHITFLATDCQWRKLAEYWEECGFTWVKIDRCKKNQALIRVQMKRKEKPHLKPRIIK
jgi:hypothetical protein